MQLVLYSNLVESTQKWINLGCLRIEDRRSMKKGLKTFIQFITLNARHLNYIRCPCLQCGNLMNHTPQVIREHLYFNGIDQSYRIWYWHGEVVPSKEATIVKEYHSDKLNCDDLDNTIQMVHDVQNDYVKDPQSFGTLLEDAEKPLYPGCSKFTKLFALVKLYNLKARYM